MIDRIEAWLRLRDTARFKRDARDAADAVDDIGDKSHQTDEKVEGLGDSVTQLGKKLSGGGTVADMGVLGRFTKGLGWAAIFAAPFIVALGGALVAVAGSAAMAGIALAALGAGAIGILAVGLGPLVGVGVGIANSFKEVNDALNAYHEAVQTYGKDSTQAETAMKRFQAAVKMNGGKDMLTLVRNIKSLGTAWKQGTRPALADMIGMMKDASGAARTLVPTIAGIANKSAAAARSALAPIFADIQTGGLDNILKGLGDSFARIAGPAAQAAYSLIKAFGNIALLAAPYVEKLVQGIASLAARFEAWTASQAGADFIQTAMDHLQSWWNLLKAIGGLLATVLGGGASEGKGLVDSLTGVLNKWNEWLSSTEGQAAMKSFFHDAAELTKTFFNYLAKLTAAAFLFGRALMPIYNAVLKPLIGVLMGLWNQLRPLAPFFKLLGGVILVAVKVAVFNLLLPFRGLILILKGINFLVRSAGSIWGAFKAVARALWTVIKGVGSAFLWVIQKLAKISPLLGLARAAFIHAGDAARLVGGVVKAAMSAARTAIGWVIGKLQALWNKTSGVRDAIKGAWSGVWNGLKDGFKAAYDFIKQGLEWIKGAIDDVKGALDSIPDVTPWEGLSPIGGDWLPPAVLAAAAAAGTAGTPVSALPSAAPTPAAADSPDADLPALEPPKGGKRELRVPVFIGRRQVAEAVKDDIDDEFARR